jgi:hypothetical protein
MDAGNAPSMLYFNTRCLKQKCPAWSVSILHVLRRPLSSRERTRADAALKILVSDTHRHRCVHAAQSLWLFQLGSLSTAVKASARTATIASWRQLPIGIVLLRETPWRPTPSLDARYEHGTQNCLRAT